ncbi:MAG: hypothetical protein KDN20_07815 [Verrucomicrobiae bacterium]|nr:hypothetical protein [Verrucomicrobiae bacterium]
MKTFTKNTTSLTMTALMAVVTSWIGFGGVESGLAQQAQVKELSAMILMKDNSRQRGFVQNSNEKGLLFSLVEGAPGSGKAWDTEVVAVAFDDADEIMREARAAYNQGAFDTAATEFGKIADAYVIAAYVPNSFVAEARYYQMESLRRLGRWAEISPLMTTPAALAIPTRLPEFYQPQHKLNALWGQLGAGQLEGVKAEVEARTVPQTGSSKLLPSPAFQKMPLRELVQITFMRAKLNEADNLPDLALADYYRTFSLTFANDGVLALQAMQGALAIQAKNPALQDEEARKGTVALRQIESLAYLYKNAFAKGQVDAALAPFAVKPELPKPPAPKEAEAPADGAAAPAAADAKEKKEEPAPAADAKGEAKPKADK